MAQPHDDGSARAQSSRRPRRLETPTRRRGISWSQRRRVNTCCGMRQKACALTLVRAARVCCVWVCRCGTVDSYRETDDGHGLLDHHNVLPVLRPAEGPGVDGDGRDRRRRARRDRRWTARRHSRLRLWHLCGHGPCCVRPITCRHHECGDATSQQQVKRNDAASFVREDAATGTGELRSREIVWDEREQQARVLTVSPPSPATGEGSMVWF